MGAHTVNTSGRTHTHSRGKRKHVGVLWKPYRNSSDFTVNLRSSGVQVHCPHSPLGHSFFFFHPVHYRVSLPVLPRLSHLTTFSRSLVSFVSSLPPPFHLQHSSFLSFYVSIYLPLFLLSISSPFISLPVTISFNFYLCLFLCISNRCLFLFFFVSPQYQSGRTYNYIYELRENHKTELEKRNILKQE